MSYILLTGNTVHVLKAVEKVSPFFRSVKVDALHHPVPIPQHIEGKKGKEEVLRRVPSFSCLFSPATRAAARSQTKICSLKREESARHTCERRAKEKKGNEYILLLLFSPLLVQNRFASFSHCVCVSVCVAVVEGVVVFDRGEEGGREREVCV